MDKTTSVVSYTTSGTVGVGGLLSSEWIMVISAVFFAALTFFVNWAYQKRREKREQEHAALDAMYKAAREQREQELHALQRAALIGREAIGDTTTLVDQSAAGDPGKQG